MIDTHAHLNFKDFAKDYSKIIQDSQDNDIEAIINVGSDLQTSEKALKIAAESDVCFASVGIHPIHTDRVKGMMSKEIQKKLEILGQAKKVVAVGETGLDYYHLPSVKVEQERIKEEQKKLFEIHLTLSQKLDLPLILHCRDAYDDLLEIIQKTMEQWSNRTMVRGVIHCFCGSLETAKRFLDLGFNIGFTGMITYPGNENLSEVIKVIPLDKILVETDCPYLAPQIKRGERNLPYYVRYVILHIAKAKGLRFEEVEKATTRNAVKLFQCF